MALSSSRLLILKHSFKSERDGQVCSPLPQRGKGVSRRTHLAKAGTEAHFWKGKTAYNVKSTPISVQVTMNSTEFESGGFVFQFTECSLALKKK